MDTLKHLNATRDKLIQELHTVSEQDFNRKPDATTWSPKEVSEHIALMDKYIAFLMKKGKTEEKKTVKKPIRFTTVRGIKVHAPAPVDPQAAEKSKNEILNLLFESRMDVLEMYKSFSREQKKQLAMKHPVFGYLSLEQWFDFLGYHELRHVKQLQEVRKQLKI